MKATEENERGNEDGKEGRKRAEGKGGGGEKGVHHYTHF